MILRRLYALMILVVMSAALAGCGTRAPEQADVSFTATLIMESGGGEAVYKADITKKAQRLQMLSPGSGAVVLREDLGVVWALMDDKRLYIELPFRPENKNPLVYVPDEVVLYEALGEETLDGRAVTKERMKIRNEGAEEMDLYRWFDAGLGWPVRAEAVDGSWKLRFEDITPGRFDPSAFEVPEGYNMITAHKHGM